MFVAVFKGLLFVKKKPFVFPFFFQKSEKKIERGEPALRRLGIGKDETKVTFFRALRISGAANNVRARLESPAA